MPNQGLERRIASTLSRLSTALGRAERSRPTMHKHCEKPMTAPRTAGLRGPARPRGAGPAGRLPVLAAPPALGAELPVTPGSAPRPSRSRKPACRCRNWRPTRPRNTRSSAATRCGPFPACSSRALALARAVGHEHGGGAQPAPDLPGPAAGAGKDRRARPAAPARDGRRARRRPKPCGSRRARASSRWPTAAVPTLQTHLIEPFLAEPRDHRRGGAAAGPAHRGRAGKPGADHARRPGLCARAGHHAAEAARGRAAPTTTACSATPSR